jgi:hypothetical protein
VSAQERIVSAFIAHQPTGEDCDGAGLVCNEPGHLADALTAAGLVVIDPEDREQVERLTDLLMDTCAYSAPHGVGEVQQALRSLIAPPRPEEPMGLGAVVEDARGHLYIRLMPEPDSRTPERVWADQSSTEMRYDDIKAVRVLSEGWRADD